MQFHGRDTAQYDSSQRGGCTQARVPLTDERVCTPAGISGEDGNDRS